MPVTAGGPVTVPSIVSMPQLAFPTVPQAPPPCERTAGLELTKPNVASPIDDWTVMLPGDVANRVVHRPASAICGAPKRSSRVPAANAVRVPKNVRGSTGPTGLLGRAFTVPLTVACAAYSDFGPTSPAARDARRSNHATTVLVGRSRLLYEAAASQFDDRPPVAGPRKVFSAVWSAAGRPGLSGSSGFSTSLARGPSLTTSGTPATDCGSGIASRNLLLSVMLSSTGQTATVTQGYWNVVAAKLAGVAYRSGFSYCGNTTAS